MVWSCLKPFLFMANDYESIRQWHFRQLENSPWYGEDYQVLCLLWPGLLLQPRGGSNSCLRTYPPANEDLQTSADWIRQLRNSSPYCQVILFLILYIPRSALLQSWALGPERTLFSESWPLGWSTFKLLRANRYVYWAYNAIKAASLMLILKEPKCNLTTYNMVTP